MQNQNDPSFPVEGFQRLAGLEAGHFWFEGRNNLIQWALSKYAPTAKSFFEIGCGTGFVLSGICRRFPTLRLGGGELYEEGLTFARTRLPGIELRQVDATAMPNIGQWDVIGAFDVLEHIIRDDAALTGIYQALEPKGTLLISVPQHMWLWSSVDEVSFHQRRYSRRQLVERVTAAGFKVQMTTSFVSLLLPLMLLTRSRKRSKPVDTEAEFKLSPTANRMLRTAMRAELNLIRAGARFPAGGSLLLIARKS